MNHLKQIRLVGAILMVIFCTCKSKADIFQWDWVNPADPSLGKFETSILCPDGIGVWAKDYTNLSHLNLTKAYLIGANLIYSNSMGVTLNNADLTGANLTGATVVGWLNHVTLDSANCTGAELGGDLDNASLIGANLTGASVNGSLNNSDMTGAMIYGAHFFDSNLTVSQLYSTASYKAKDLSGVIFPGPNTITGSKFDLTGENFADFNLSGTGIYDVIVKGANFSGSNLIASQLYSTASYNAKDLSGIILPSNIDLTGGKFSGCNFSGATVPAILTNAILTGVNFTNASLNNANLSGADLRGAFGESLASVSSLHNTIYPDGKIIGLTITAGEKLIIHNNTIPIHVTGSAIFDPAATLELLMDDLSWNSTISFDAGTSLTLAGNLHLEFESAPNLVGHTFKLFDWTGTSHSGEFNILTSCTWDTSNLYTTGEATLIAAPEPSTLVLLGLSAFGIFTWAWQRSRKVV